VVLYDYYFNKKSVISLTREKASKLHVYGLSRTSPVKQAWIEFSRCLLAFSLPERDGGCLIHATWERDLLYSTALFLHNMNRKSASLKQYMANPLLSKPSKMWAP